MGVPTIPLRSYDYYGTREKVSGDVLGKNNRSRDERKISIHGFYGDNDTPTMITGSEIKTRAI